MFNLEEVLKNFKGKYYIPNDEEIDYKKLYEQQKQRVDELEEKIDKNKRLHDAAIKSAGILFSDEKQRADELEKRWEKIKEHFIKEKEQAFGILSWSRNNGVLELIERLEENNNA